MKRLIPAAVLLVLLAGLSGCGSRKVSVSGTVTHGGQKLAWPDGGKLLVLFLPENPEKNEARYSAQTDTATSTYKIDAIPPGKYTVAIQQFDEHFMDAFNKAHDAARTTIEVVVSAEGGVIDIDIPATPGAKVGFGGGPPGGKGGFGRKGMGKKGGEPPEPPPGPPSQGEPGKTDVAPPPTEKKGEPAKPDDKKD